MLINTEVQILYGYQIIGKFGEVFLSFYYNILAEF